AARRDVAELEVPLEVLPRAVAADPETRCRVLLLDADGRRLIGAFVEPLEMMRPEEEGRRFRRAPPQVELATGDVDVIGVVAEGLLDERLEVEDHEIVRALEEQHRLDREPRGGNRD